MNLRTHTAYPEIQINEHNVAVVKIYGAKGDLLLKEVLAGETRKEAITKASNYVKKNAPKYLIKE